MQHIDLILETASKINDNKMSEQEAIQFLIDNLDKEDIVRCYMGADKAFETLMDNVDPSDETLMIAWELVESAADKLEL